MVVTGEQGFLDDETTGAPAPARRRRALRPLVVFVVTATVYLLSAWKLGHTKSPQYAYWDQVANAFRHGRLDVGNPKITHDLTLHDGKWYVPFPPLPALLLVPWAMVGTVNTVVFSLLLGAVSTALVDVLLRALRQRGIVTLSTPTLTWLVIMWAVGTVHWYLAVGGSVWFLSQIATTTFLLASLASAAKRRPLIAGVCLGVSALGRPTILLALPAVVALAVDTAGTWRRIAATTAIPAGLIAATLLVYNQARFGSLTDFGYTTQNVAKELAVDLHKHGQFALRYIPRNLWAMLMAGPVKDARSWKITPDGQGMSMFLTTPAWAFAFSADHCRRLVRWCWAAVLLLLVPIVTYYNTGWYQFGFRFALDFMPVLTILLALGLDRFEVHFGRIAPRLLICIGIAINLWGMLWFK